MTGLWPAGWTPPRPGTTGADTKNIGAKAAPLILTLGLPPALQREADALRGSLAPEAARHAPAHVSLFRHLPGPSLPSVEADLRAVVRGNRAPSFNIGSPVWREGRWMAPVSSPEADLLREDLARRWHGLLAPGDLAPPRLHVSLSAGACTAPPPLAPGAGPWQSPALLLWQYGKAFWTPLVAFAFRR